MREWLDSAYPPSAAQVAQAKAAGYAGWAGYFKFGNDGVLNGWADSDFQRVLDGGLQTLAYCSGWADPAQVKARAAGLRIAACLDDESGMRPDGSWVQGWLNTAASGLYGNSPVHGDRQAAFHVLADYPLSGDPGGESWPSWLIRPPGPVAWQWAGSHSWAGITVDSTWADDDFPGLFGGNSTQAEDETLLYVGPTHPLAASLRAYVAGNYYGQPFASLAPEGGVTVGAVYAVDGYCYSSSSVHATTPPEADFVWWHVKTGGWVPDALLDTSTLAGAPAAAWPTSESVAALFDAATGRAIGIGGGSVAGPQGPPGPVGPVGPQGPPGPQGPEGPKPTTATIVSATISSGTVTLG